jgi:hypothetical protein
MWSACIDEGKNHCPSQSVEKIQLNKNYEYEYTVLAKQEIVMLCTYLT